MKGMGIVRHRRWLAYGFRHGLMIRPLGVLSHDGARVVPRFLRLSDAGIQRDGRVLPELLRHTEGGDPMSVTRVPERYIPSVERASTVFQVWFDIASGTCLVAGPLCQTCVAGWQAVENAALAYDLAVSVAHPARREPAWLTTVDEVAW